MEWISVQDGFPACKHGDSSEPVLLLVELKPRGEIKRVVVVGEYDDTGTSTIWKVWHEYVNEKGYHDVHGFDIEIDDVTHWMPIPELPKNEYGMDISK